MEEFGERSDITKNWIFLFVRFSVPELLVHIKQRTKTNKTVTFRPLNKIVVISFSFKVILCGVPAVVQWDLWHLSLKWPSGLRILHCHSCTVGRNCGWDPIPGPGALYAIGWPKKKKKKKSPGFLVVVWVFHPPSHSGTWGLCYYQYTVSKMSQGINIQLAGCGKEECRVVTEVFLGQLSKWHRSLLPTFYWPVTWPHLTSGENGK